MSNTILVDMDGVLTNFIKGLTQSLNLDYDDVLGTWPKGKFLLEEVFGLSEDEVWRKIDSLGESFWENLEYYSHAQELWDLCSNYGTVYICTSPSKDPSCFSGKIKSLLKWRGSNFRNYILTPHKHLLANKETVLIDDSNSNISKFEKAGGKAIIFPAVQNSLYFLENHALDHVKLYLDSLTRGSNNGLSKQVFSSGS